MKQAGKTLVATEPPQDKPWRETTIPPQLNGAGLDVYAFRVYVHLADEWQQNENDQMSVGGIAAATGISLSRTRTAVRELVRRNMVIREDVEGWPPVFTLTSSRGWRA